jgi:hypothetical protein
MCLVIVVMAAVWPIVLWRMCDGGGSVKKESKKMSKQLRITILGKTRCVLLHFDSSKHCVCPLYKFLYAFKVVKLFSETPCISVIRSAREPYKMNWLPACLRPLCYLSIGPSRSVTLKRNFSFEKLSAVRQLQQNIFGGFHFSFRTSELTGRMFESRSWHNSLFASSQLLFFPEFSPL